MEIYEREKKTKNKHTYSKERVLGAASMFNRNDVYVIDDDRNHDDILSFLLSFF